MFNWMNRSPWGADGPLRAIHPDGVPCPLRARLMDPQRCVDCKWTTEMAVDADGHPAAVRCKPPMSVVLANVLSDDD